MKLSTGQKVTIFVILLLLIDQAIKVAVKLNMTVGESIHVFGDWFQILFIENRGMAFGMQFGTGIFGKLFLSLLRLGLIGLLIWYLHKLIKRDNGSSSVSKTPTKVPVGVLVGLALVLVGAVGNMLDSLFYGLIFSASDTMQKAVLFPIGGGYAPMMFGQVVDMFYFPIIDTNLPKWFPIWGGDNIVFFRPIFNFADSCVSVGVIYLLLFQRKFFK
jgi:signal peptidase II